MEFNANSPVGLWESCKRKSLIRAIECISQYEHPGSAQEISDGSAEQIATALTEGCGFLQTMEFPLGIMHGLVRHAPGILKHDTFGDTLHECFAQSVFCEMQDQIAPALRARVAELVAKHRAWQPPKTVPAGQKQAE